MSALQQGTMLFEILGKEPNFIKVPIEVMDVVIKVLDTFAGQLGNMRDAAEFGKIGRYYAAESMLVMVRGVGCTSTAVECSWQLIPALESAWFLQPSNAEMCSRM
jgi:hypothetical protein